MSAVRVDTSSWLSGAVLVGDSGFGVLGSAIPSTGDNGAGYAYNDLSLPADNAKEICGRITSWPSAGVLVAYEDTSFTFTGSPDSFDYQLYVDGVAVGSPVTVTLVVGDSATHAASGALVAGNSTVAGSSAKTHVFASSGAIVSASAAVAGTASAVRTHVSSGALDAGSAQMAGSVSSLSDAVTLALILKILANRQELDAVTGTFRLYDDDGATILYEVGAWEDAAGTVRYSGGTLRRIDRLQ